MTAIRGLISQNLNICLIVFSTTFVTLRFYVRGFMTKSLGLDDAFSLCALGVLLAQASLEIKEVRHGGGEHLVNLTPEQAAAFFIILPTMQLLYFLGTGFVRLSIIAFIPRLTKERKFVYIAWSLGCAVFSMTTICFFIMLFECKHVPDLWDKQRPGAQCLSSVKEGYMFWAHGGIGLFIDILLLLTPIWIIYSRMMFSATTKRVLLVFSVGFFVVITGAVRLGIIVTTNFAIDTPFTLIKTSVWTDLEGHVGLWVACFPTLQPLLRIVTRSLGLSSKKGSATRQKSSSNMNGMSKSMGTRRTQGYLQHGTKRADSLSDDASGKGIMGYEEREVGLEMNYLGTVTTDRDRTMPRNEKGIVRTTDIVVMHD